jgi:hypothetical protein
MPGSPEQHNRRHDLRSQAHGLYDSGCSQLLSFLAFATGLRRPGIGDIRIWNTAYSADRGARV